MARNGKQWSLIVLGAACFWSLGSIANGQAQSFFTNAPAVSYTAAQAERSKAVYSANCASCHGADLNGGQFGPTLRGDNFKAHWSNQPPEALYGFMVTKMPPSSPASLKNVDYADLEAYILQA